MVAWERALAEAAGVLGPGGVIVGADLLGTAPARLLHQAEGADVRLLTLLPLQEITVRPGVARFTVRFTARKQPSRPG